MNQLSIKTFQVKTNEDNKQSKISVSDDASLQEKKVLSTLKHGLFSYPILQAADILVHRATHVPVGEDQRQHLEFARECVTNFNHAYGGQYLVSPETILCMYFPPSPLLCYPFMGISPLCYPAFFFFPFPLHHPYNLCYYHLLTPTHSYSSP